MYPEEMVAPMRAELTSIGLKELKTEQDVKETLDKKDGTTFMVINSVCGCAAGNARPGIKLAINNKNLPTNMVTVFAGQDKEATNKVREYISGYPPSSPSMALFKNGEPVFMLPRHQIEGRYPDQIARDLIEAFDKHCN